MPDGFPQTIQNVRANPVSGGHYWVGPFATANLNITAGEGTQIAIPFFNSTPLSIIQLGIEIVTPGTAGALLRVGVYLDRGDNVGPGQLLIDAGTIDETQAAGIHGVPAVFTLPVGLVWFSYAGQGAPTTHAQNRGQSGGNAASGYYNSDVYNTFVPGNSSGFFRGGQSGAFTSPWPAANIVPGAAAGNFTRVQALVA